ncbi:NAD(P)H-hydrate dehydratase [uncultured Sphingomonas sp.]|uniref:NAD(P)H-hydrate dehydratase n=1 Tax=uncultured Sphingomonas sp. TaxID=158754 RepID=UPI0035C9D865
MIPIEGQPILTAVQMLAAEDRAAPTIDAMYALMERAGAGVAAAVARLCPDEETLILCGPGNNGGDGYVAARILRERGCPVRVAAAGEPRTDLSRRARASWPGPVEAIADARSAAVLVDALFGIGLTRPLEAGLLATLHRLASAARFRIAVDLPSGVATDTGALLSEPPRFDLTLALGALKVAHVLHPAASHMGERRVLDLGVSIMAKGGRLHRTPPDADRDREASVLGRPTLPEPAAGSHKFNRGMVVVIGGAMPGASELAALAAARVGAGYVLLLGGVSDLPRAIVRGPWRTDALADPRIDALVVGPGLGRDDVARERFDAAWASAHPLVIDGDGLRLLDPDARRVAPVVLTPHDGEFDYLFGPGGGGKIVRARAAARRSDAVVMFKGPDTVIAAPDGRAAVSAGASHWLSTAGTGDVLSGTCGAMLASGLTPFDAASAAVWLHGEAARLLGPAFIADDLADALTPARASP